MNSITVCGRITKDLDVRKVGDKQTSVCNFSLADNYWGQGGQQTNWWECVVWGGMADNLAKFCGKGSQITIVGEAQTEKWQTKEGEERKTTRIQVRNVEFGAKSSGGNGNGGGGGATAENPGNVSVDSEIPW